jgi:hypothetical protein
MVKDIEFFDATPDRRLLVDIGAANYTVPQAIAELVANCMDAKVPIDEFQVAPIQIDISVTDESVSIIDNGQGMERHVLGEAMRLSAIMDAVTGNTRTRKGMYGLGMKAACASLGLLWEITSKPANDDNEYIVEVDLDVWLKNADRTDWKMGVEKRKFDPNTSPLGFREHGTAIVVKRLRESFTIPTAVTELIGMAYKPHLESGDKILVNDFEVQPKRYDLIEGSKIPINLKIGSEVVTGWVGLDKKTHNDGNYGINIYREKQLVDAWNKDFIRAHLMNSRVVGEIELPFVNANFHKNGLNKGTVEWKNVKEGMKELLKPAVKASGDMAKNKKDPTRSAKAITGLRQAYGAIVTCLPPDAASIDVNSVPVPGAAAKPSVIPNPLAHGSLGDIQIENSIYSLSNRLEDLEDERLPWDYIFDEPTRDLQIIINTQSRVYQYSTDQLLVSTLALSEVLIGFMMKYHGYSYEKAKENRDNWLHSSLASRVQVGTKSG